MTQRGFRGQAVAPIAITMGEPAGIGAEITLKAWQALRDTEIVFFLLHDPASLEVSASALAPKVPIRTIGDPAEATTIFRDELPVMAMGLPAAVVPGVLDARNALAVIESIRRAVTLTQRGNASALVTNPIHKSALYASGFTFPGHTEFLEHLAGEPFQATMMLACPALKVVPVTIHESLMTAVARLSTADIVATALATREALRRDFGVAKPRLAIAGLNPHAGEDGTMGREEIEIIAPAVKALIDRGVDATGPWPPDTMFTPRARLEYDAAICMYHDQALIPLKTLDVDGGVNVTLGLPFVRTSPDHGTALNLAGKGLADPGSLIAAIRMAADIAAYRRQETRYENYQTRRQH